MEWLLGNVSNILDIGGGVVGLGAAIVTTASALDRTTKRINIKGTVRDIEKVTNFLRKMLSFLALNNFGSVGRK